MSASGGLVAQGILCRACVTAAWNAGRQLLQADAKHPKSNLWL
jgi:hypothetical protein